MTFSPPFSKISWRQPVAIALCDLCMVLHRQLFASIAYKIRCLLTSTWSAGWNINHKHTFIYSVTYFIKKVTYNSHTGSMHISLVLYKPQQKKLSLQWNTNKVGHIWAEKVGKRPHELAVTQRYTQAAWRHRLPIHYRPLSWRKSLTLSRSSFLNYSTVRCPLVTFQPASRRRLSPQLSRNQCSTLPMPTRIDQSRTFRWFQSFLNVSSFSSWWSIWRQPTSCRSCSPDPDKVIRQKPLYSGCCPTSFKLSTVATWLL